MESKNVRLDVRVYSKKKKIMGCPHIRKYVEKDKARILFQLFIYMKNDHFEQYYYLGESQTV